MQEHQSHPPRPGSRASRHGRHRVTRSFVTRNSTRATVAALTTGTMAMSGVAVAGSFGGPSADQDTGDTTIAANSLGSLIGSAEVGPPPVPIQVQAVSATTRASTSLTVGTPDVTVNADEPVEVTFRLATSSGAGAAHQDILVQVLLPAGWTTFKALRTDGQGYAGYTARVLTTTRVRAVFGGNAKLTSATSQPAVLRVRPQAPPATTQGQASRGATRTATSTAPDASPAAQPTGSTIGQRAVYLASLQAGKPYVYGAAGPYSFDCSGLVQYVYKQLGKTLPRTTDQQYAATARVARGSQQPGDLIFFGQPGAIYHMGIYAGDGKIWVAPKSGDVVKLEAIWTSSYSVGRVT